MAKVSVIVPVYNVEKYISRCIESILQQTFNDFELILVDDGSRDRSGVICDEYAGIDSRIKVIHKGNGGVSTARNAGIDIAQGEWIAFIDSDDYVDSRYIATLYAPTQQYACDMVVGSVIKAYATRSERITFEDDFVEYDSFGRLFVHHRLQEYGGPGGKLFFNDIVKSNRLRFNESVRLGEDAMFVLSYIPYSKGVKLMSEAMYYYDVMVPDSLTKSHNKLSVEMAGFVTISKVAQELAHFFCSREEVFSYLCAKYLDRVIKAIYASSNTRTLRVEMLKRIPLPKCRLYRPEATWKDRIIKWCLGHGFYYMFDFFYMRALKRIA